MKTPWSPQVRVLACAALVLAACAPEVETGSPAASRSASLASGGSTPARRFGQVILPSGKTLNAELAITPAEQARGYMGRKEILPDEGMLFLHERPGVRRFWMKNCLTAIDIIWLDRDDRVVFIEHSAPPCASDPCPSYGPAIPTYRVFEMRAGQSRAENLQVGDRLRVLIDGEHP